MSELPIKPYSLEIEKLFDSFNSSIKGIRSAEVAERVEKYGANVLPMKAPITLLQIFFHQFLNPLIYILGGAAAVSFALSDYSDAFFIGIVLVINAVIGTIQEYSAEKSAQALRKMAASKCLVEREGEIFEVDAENLVPGDIVLLESGQKVPADLRLVTSHWLEIDESLLTGESVSVAKKHDLILPEEAALGDRKNMAYTGSLVTKGRAKGLVTSTGLKTELGKIANSISEGVSAKPPLLIRMEKFTKNIAVSLIFIVSLMAIFLLSRGDSWQEVMMFSVAIAVSAIPEGLPVALTITLAIASRRMAKRNVIVRKLPAVEALGSCTFIATDKTGTLTVNQLTVQKVGLPHLPSAWVEGSGLDPKGSVASIEGIDEQTQLALLKPLVLAGTLCNEGQLAHKNGTWIGHGDAVDLAFLVLTHKVGLQPSEIRDQYHSVAEIPFEPENQYAAILHQCEDSHLISIKGALERLLLMCHQMNSPQGTIPLDSTSIIQQADELASAGYRVLALAQKTSANPNEALQKQLHQMTFLGIVGMIDPLRSEAKDAVQSCKRAGIDVAMVTGDHPKTALAIAKELGLAQEMKDVVSGPQLKSASSKEKKGKLIENARVFARVEPQQKLEIVRYLLDSGRFVAVTGDGANDAPALKAANVGIAMGQSGTDIAKETSDLIITDDRFASIIAGIEEGRIAYANVRKVVYLLISTGVAEILMFSLALIFGVPLPLTAIQILWLNLVTNGIQDVGIAFEPGEGDELSRPPRKSDEPIFNRRMLEQVFLSALVIGGISFWYFNSLIGSGYSIEVSRNLTLLLMVLFQNIMVGNCRSETKSTFTLNPLRNPLLLFGTITAQLIHIMAMYTPGIREMLGLMPVSLTEWVHLFLLALTVLVVIEIYKAIRRLFSY